MRRALLSLSLIGLIAVGAALPGFQSHVAAQDATPEAGMEEVGVSYLPIGFADHVQLPSEGSLIVVQVTLEPGAISPSDPNDPTGAMIVMGTGTLTIQIDHDWTITRAGAEFGTNEAVASNAEAMLGPGDSAFLPGSVGGEVRNDGDEVATATLFLVVPQDEIDAQMAQATPAS